MQSCNAWVKNNHHWAKRRQEAPAQHDAESAARSFCNQFLYAFVVWHFSGLTFSSWISERLVPVLPAARVWSGRHGFHPISPLQGYSVTSFFVLSLFDTSLDWHFPHEYLNDLYLLILPSVSVWSGRHWFHPGITLRYIEDVSILVRVHLPLGVSLQPKQIVSLIVYVNLHFAATFNTNYRSRKKPCRPKELHWVSSSAISAAGIRLSKGATYMIPFSTKHYACSPLMLTFHRLISIIKQKSTPPFRSPQSSQTPTASEKNEMKQEFQALKKTFVEFQLNFDAKLDAKLKVTI